MIHKNLFIILWLKKLRIISTFYICPLIYTEDLTYNLASLLNFTSYFIINFYCTICSWLCNKNFLIWNSISLSKIFSFSKKKYCSKTIKCIRKMLELSYHFQLCLWTHFFNLYHIVKLLWVVLSMIVYKEPLVICLSSAVVSQPIITCGFNWLIQVLESIRKAFIQLDRVSWFRSHSPCTPLTAALWDSSSVTGCWGLQEVGVLQKEYAVYSMVFVPWFAPYFNLLFCHFFIWGHASPCPDNNEMCPDFYCSHDYPVVKLTVAATLKFPESVKMLAKDAWIEP